MAFIQTLPQGPLDIVGDVHGEWEALQRLMDHLGYDEDAVHPHGRHLVFVGDIVDRGPRSPTVARKVMEWHQQGRVTMVLGNHEINILQGSAKDGAGWYWSEQQQRDERYEPYERMPEDQKEGFVAWLNTLPLAVERSDLRVVHAAWNPESMEQIRGWDQEKSKRTLAERYLQIKQSINDQLKASGVLDQYEQEQRDYADILHNESAQEIPEIPGHIQYDHSHQQGNPIRVITTGMEGPSPSPFFAGGRWRRVHRKPWWSDYQGDQAVVFGHFWRKALMGDAAEQAHRIHDPEYSLFDRGTWHWHGPRHNIFCVDYSVGVRYRERQGLWPKGSTHLVALQWPEKICVLDNGDRYVTQTQESSPIEKETVSSSEGPEKKEAT